MSLDSSSITISNQTNIDQSPLTIVKSETLKNVDEVIDLTMQVAEETIEVKDLDVGGALKRIKKDTIGIEGAKIEGKYIDYLNLMIKKHQSNERQVKGEVIVIDSYDGAEHYTSNATKASITSYNSQIFAKSMQHDEEEISTAESFNILTWQQILADEKLENIIPVVESIYEEKSQLMERTNSIVNECNFNFYDMHDAKMLYLISIPVGLERIIHFCFVNVKEERELQMNLISVLLLKMMSN